VLFRSCFEAQGNKHQDSGRRNGGSASVGGVSVAQFKELEAKVDKILYILENLAEDEEDNYYNRVFEVVTYKEED
jgi:hypothetical protein